MSIALHARSERHALGLLGSPETQCVSVAASAQAPPPPPSPPPTAASCLCAFAPSRPMRPEGAETTIPSLLTLATHACRVPQRWAVAHSSVSP